MKLSDMREILAKRDIQLTKSLGQNFLHDENQLRKIVTAAELSRADKVLEIGPGLGPLTKMLLENAGEVLAIEMDARLVDFLCERFGTEERNTDLLADTLKNSESKNQAGEFHLLHDDALKFLQKEKRDWRDWKLVSNLPYSVASPILVELACGARAPKKIVATLQLEVAKRVMAQADDDAYGILTLLVQLDFAPQTFFKIPPECFFPSPDVDSACVILNRREQPLLPENLRASFVKIVKRAFSQRRKMMLKLLKQDWPVEKLNAAFAESKISPQERAEKLSLERFVELTELLYEKI
jgi:16S rRNA (adenine1518-N6/adenine1519-N6)-dimethyltransferase